MERPFSIKGKEDLGIPIVISVKGKISLLTLLTGGETKVAEGVMTVGLHIQGLLKETLLRSQ